MEERMSFKPLAVVFVVFLFLILFLGFRIISNPTSYIGKAGDAGIVDGETSSVWASLYSVKAGESFNVTVFLHNSSDRAVSGKAVKLMLSPKELVGQSLYEGTSDAIGQVVFAISTKAPGKLSISATGDNVSLSKTLSIEVIK